MINYRSFWNTVLVTTLFVGIFDLLLATGMQWTRNGEFPSKMLFYMAGGVLGLETSMQGGFWVALVGLITHFVISFCFTIAVFLVFTYFKFHKLPKRTMFLFGVLYTLITNVFMHFVALQLTRLPPPKELKINVVGYILFTIGFTIPIFYNAWKHYTLRNQANEEISV
ncbi:MAG TPA: hypothetical protein VIL31_02550 [Cyclobacteriaceae bacterium]|jgi:hypothetical protein